MRLDELTDGHLVCRRLAHVFKRPVRGQRLQVHQRVSPRVQPKVGMVCGAQAVRDDAGVPGCSALFPLADVRALAGVGRVRRVRKGLDAGAAILVRNLAQRVLPRLFELVLVELGHYFSHPAATDAGAHTSAPAPAAACRRSGVAMQGRKQLRLDRRKRAGGRDALVWRPVRRKGFGKDDERLGRNGHGLTHKLLQDGLAAAVVRLLPVDNVGVDVGEYFHANVVREARIVAQRHVASVDYDVHGGKGRRQHLTRHNGVGKVEVRIVPRRHRAAQK